MRLLGWREGIVFGVAAAFMSGILALPAMGANVSFVTLHYSADRFVPQFHFDGPVVQGDAAALATLIDEFVDCNPDALDPDGANCAVVTLNSPGGNYYEGLRLAALMRERAITTVVEDGAQCYSACAFAFLGGSGHSWQEGIGAYIDRIVEPGGILGFHAPYFAPDSLNGLVAEYGLDEVLGASRDDISLMVQQLVDWNVNPNALSRVVRMGPSETYDIITGADYAMLWAQLPPAPLHYWNSDANSAIRNACINLLAYHLNALPDAVTDRLSSVPEVDLARNVQGKSLTGFRLEADTPLAPSYCGLPHDQFNLGKDIDLALYTAAGVSGAARPIVSLFNRTDSWSTMGVGGAPTRRNMQKGSMSHLFVDVSNPVESLFVSLMNYLPLRKFARFDALGLPEDNVDFPVSEMPMTVVAQTPKARVMIYGQQQIIIEAGSQLLYVTGRRELENRFDVDVGLVEEYENTFVVAGQYFTGRPYLWLGLKGREGATALVRIETPDMPDDIAAAFAEQSKIACSFALHDHRLDCG